MKGKKTKKIELWLEYQDFKECVKGAEPVLLEEQQRNVVAAWNMMGGEIVWQFLDAISEYLQVNDAELFIDGLIIMQDHARATK